MILLVEADGAELVGHLEWNSRSASSGTEAALLLQSYSATNNGSERGHTPSPPIPLFIRGGKYDKLSGWRIGEYLWTSKARNKWGDKDCENLRWEGIIASPPKDDDPRFYKVKDTVFTSADASQLDGVITEHPTELIDSVYSYAFNGWVYYCNTNLIEGQWDATQSRIYARLPTHLIPIDLPESRPFQFQIPCRGVLHPHGDPTYSYIGNNSYIINAGHCSVSAAPKDAGLTLAWCPPNWKRFSGGHNLGGFNWYSDFPYGFWKIKWKAPRYKNYTGSPWWVERKNLVWEVEEGCFGSSRKWNTCMSLLFSTDRSKVYYTFRGPGGVHDVYCPKPRNGQPVLKRPRQLAPAILSCQPLVRQLPTITSVLSSAARKVRRFDWVAAIGQYREKLMRDAMNNVRFVDINTTRYVYELRELKRSIMPIVNVLRRPTSPKNWANLWLTYRYGIRLFFNDTRKLIEAAKRSGDLRNPEIIKGRSRMQVGIDVYGLPANVTITLNLKGQRGNALLQRLLLALRQWDVIISAKNAWDWIPYSFVLDWFIPIGDELEKLDEKVDEQLFHLETAEWSVLATGWTPVELANIEMIGMPTLRFYKRWHEDPKDSKSLVSETPVTYGEGVNLIHLLDGLALIVQRRLR